MHFSVFLLQASASSNASHQNLVDLLWSSDPVVKFVLVTLLLFSIFSWMLICFKALQLRRARRSSLRFIDRFETAPSFDQILLKMGSREESPAFEIFSVSLEELASQRKRQVENVSQSSTLDFREIERKIEKTTDFESARLEQYTPFLATTASASPFIGLFGTVWGILMAFWKIGRSGTSTLDTVGPSISEALIATAVGLAAAIPAVVAYNYFVGKTRRIRKLLEDFALDLAHRIKKDFF